MSVPSVAVPGVQALDLAKQLISLNQKAAINIRIGSEFSFSFNNQDHETSERKKSPSQLIETLKEMKSLRT